ncbi:hypothetical protein NC651_019015 [Populus alba x Populus x berolinensis]|nr:hypothetical protein NC651_019015 [Populus alba x Populus x berolinensis]
MKSKRACIYKDAPKPVKEEHQQTNEDHETFKNNDAEAVDNEASENQVDVDDVEVDELESDDGEEELDTYGMDLVIKCLLYTFYAQFPLIKHFEVISNSITTVAATTFEGLGCGCGQGLLSSCKISNL